ncbi:MAG: GTP cyclohydrolase II [Actinomycetota bacterium]
MSPKEVARVTLPTPYGTFEARAFRCSSRFVYLALIAGDIGGATPVLARVHSECLTGDALGSLRCDCGLQLHESLRAMTAEGRGVLIYATGHEGRGIGLVNKLRAYAEQDHGSDTVDANLHLGLPIDDRRYSDAAEVLKTLGVRSVRLLTNNPDKVEGLRAAGVQVDEVRPLPVAAHVRNVRYLETKQQRLGHVRPLGRALVGSLPTPPDVGPLLGPVTPPEARPYLAIKYAQSMDGRIATASGDSRWISGEAERAVSHALRARCDGIMVGVGTVLRDDPQLTVRLVAGASPVRVILDSKLRIPLDAHVLDDAAATLVLTTNQADVGKRVHLEKRNVGVRVVPAGPRGVDLPAAARVLRDAGMECVLVEGGAALITSLLAGGLVDRLIVACAPVLLGRGVEGIGDLGVTQVSEGLALTDRSVYVLDEDVLTAWSVGRPARTEDLGRESAARL